MKATLGQKIRELRIRKGLTQSDLSAGLVTPSMISQIESDKANPSHNLLASIAEKLDTPIEYFLTDTETQMEKVSVYKIAKALMATKEYEKAIPMLHELENNPSPHVSSIDVAYDIAECFLHTGQYAPATERFETVLDSAMARNDNTISLLVLNQLGELSYLEKNYPIAIHYWKKAHEMIKKGHPAELYLHAKIVQNLGSVYYKLGEYTEALAYYRESNELLEGSHHFKQIGDIYLDLSFTYRDMGEFEKAAEYSQFALSIFQSLNNMKLTIDVKAKYGIVKGETGQLDEAVTILESCMTEYREIGCEREIGLVHSDLARILIQGSQAESAYEHCEKALRYFEEGTLERAHVNRMKGQIESVRGDLEAATSLIQEGIDVYNSHQAFGELVKAYSLLGDIYKDKGQFKEAMECLENMNAAMEENLRERKIVI
ncbi:tetratricopeptide repeat protein [Tumebacillus sp. ITR2]|uniref:Tetratricopeptide repeat protein n=1 Tax=Tumebacillus amylolyticus TaxID=2801339 RepID=A0ABS1JGA9_9BACL|nr:tetratricopeptide repeat protein [Tumebacillus amylolyticus]MBL0389265.1 tetratricopeptide repeat protein [Tumebacillus amylolyticus]